MSFFWERAATDTLRTAGEALRLTKVWVDQVMIGSMPGGKDPSDMLHVTATLVEAALAHAPSLMVRDREPGESHEHPARVVFRRFKEVYPELFCNLAEDSDEYKARERLFEEGWTLCGQAMMNAATGTRSD